jgi:hypothetical protein
VFITFRGKPPDVILEAFPLLWVHLLRSQKTFGVLVGSLEVLDEGLSEVDPIVDGAGRQVFEPGPHPFREVDGEELEDEVVILWPHQAAYKAIVL